VQNGEGPRGEPSGRSSSQQRVGIAAEALMSNAGRVTRAERLLANVDGVLCCP